jgi:NitT/TauT family transport system substrate-binding protein
MNWFGSGDHAPLFLAKRAGLYAAEGLDVTIQRGTGSADAARRVELKQAEFGIADAPTTIAAVAKGANIVMLAVIFDKAANNAFFRRSRGFQGAKDFAGRKVAVAPADSHRVVWPAFARSQGLEPGAITFVNVRPEGKQAIVASGDVDLAFDLYSGYPLWEKALGKDDVGHLLWADAGFNLYGLCYVAHRDTVREKPGLCRRFLAATHRGWAATARDRALRDGAVAGERAGLDAAGVDAGDARHHRLGRDAGEGAAAGGALHQRVQQPDPAGGLRRPGLPASRAVAAARGRAPILRADAAHRLRHRLRGSSRVNSVTPNQPVG